MPTLTHHLRHAVGLLLMVVLLPLSACAQRVRGDAPAAPSAPLMQALQRGINMSIWFTYRGQTGIDPARWYPDVRDWQRIQALGLRHVRVQFDPVYFRDPQNPTAMRPDRIAELRRELAPAWTAGLVVVLAADPEGPEKSRLVRDAAGVAELAGFWRAFAGALSSTRADRLVFEVLNEPTDTDAARNRVLMQQVSQAIREAAPGHSIVVEGHGYSGVDELLAFEPLPLDNLIYSFHFYEPHTFTHQGAFWGWPTFLKFKGLPYPASPEALAPFIETADDDARPHLIQYGEQRWDAARIGRRLDLARDWAKAKGVALWCGEFGASRLGDMPLDARRRWVGDVRQALEARGMAWASFDYLGHFGLVTGNADARQLDALDAQALGLRLP